MFEESEMALYVVPAGGGTAKRITPLGTSYSNPTFSPDGQALYAAEIDTLRTSIDEILQAESPSDAAQLY